jgi:DNA repair photolyase
MDREEIIRMAREAGLPYIYQTGEVANLGLVERFAALVAAAEREKVAQWMTRQGYATGHGDTIEDLLKELEWQIEERIRNEREACAKACEEQDTGQGLLHDRAVIECAAAIRARGEK